MAQKQKWTENMLARFPRGTFVRINQVLRDTEDRTDFVREAVEQELKRRLKWSRQQKEAAHF